LAGQLIRRGERTWLIRVYRGRDAKGKREYVNRTVRGTKKEAERVLTKLLRDRDTGVLLEPSRESLAAYAPRWLSVWVKPRVRGRTFESYRWLLNKYVLPTLGARQLAQLSAADLQALYNSMTEAGYSSRTVRLTHTVVRSALAHAVKTHLIVRNPADLTEPPRQQRREMQALGPAEAGRFLEAAKGDRWAALWMLLVTAGLRPGEALGLKWADLDGAKLRIQRVRLPNGGVEEPKTARSRRVVTLPDLAVRALKEHKARQNAEKLAAGRDYEDAGFIFVGPLGRPVETRSLVRHHFDRIVAAAGLPHLRLYDLRHTHATLLLAAGEHPKVVSERLGHSTVMLTLDTYSHVLPDMQTRAAEKLDAMLAGGR